MVYLNKIVAQKTLGVNYVSVRQVDILFSIVRQLFTSSVDSNSENLSKMARLP